MPFDEDDKVFDVAKPSRAYPDASGRPVIVGHRPQAADPMVTEHKSADVQAPSAPPTPIRVAMDDEDPEETIHPVHHDIPSDKEKPSELPDTFEPEHTEEEHKPEEDHTPASEESLPPAPPEMPATFEPANMEESSEKEKSSEHGPHFSSLSSLIEPDNKDSDSKKSPEPAKAVPPEGQSTDVPPLSIPKGAGPRRRLPKLIGWLVLLLVIIFIAGYLAIDAGLVKSDIKLPFHIFNKQKTSTTATPPPTPAPATNNPTPAPEPSVPAGFTKYQNKQIGVQFVYPESWGGVVAHTTDYSSTPGYSGSSTKFTFTKQSLAVAGVVSSDYNPPGKDGGCYIDLGIKPSVSMQSLADSTKDGDSGTSTYKITTKVLTKSTDTFIYEQFQAGTPAGLGACPGASMNGYKFFGSTTGLRGIEFFWGDNSVDKTVPLSEFTKYKQDPNAYISDTDRQNFIQTAKSAATL